MDKTAIRNFAIEARKILMKSAITEAGFYGITKDGCKDPVQKGNDFEVYETVAGTENRIFGDDIKRRANLVQAIKTLGFEQVIEETAYTWFNRIIAIRFMEVNNYLPTRVRVLSSETGSGTPDIITQADTVELNLTSDELEKIQTAKRENRYDDAFRMLFIKQCNELNAILPGLFEKTDDYMELLLKITYTGDGVIRMLVDSIPEDNFNVETEGQVEIIGWMYQYYNTELKDDTFAKLKKNVKITKERIPAATQLFTPDWIVRYMVENSLGRVWIEHLRAVNPSVDEKAKAEEFGWKYYLPEAEQEDDVQAQLVEIRKSYKDLTPQDITCIDPCMGSGHILVYMFDVLMDIYRNEGFSEREAVFDILEKNIRGLDIDRRAYQLSYFALMMKARGYNRIFFRGHEDIDGNRVQAVPRVYAIEESNSIDREQLKYFGAGLDELSRNNAVNQINGLLDSMKDAKEYGSIINVPNYDWSLLRSFIAQMDDEGQASLFGFMAYQAKPLLAKLVDIGEVISRKYDAVVTNPPYMGGGGMKENLASFLASNYNIGKSDLFSAFIVKTSRMCKENGYVGLLTPYVWMFIASYADLRKYLVNDNHISTMTQLEYNAFPEACVPVCTFTFKRKGIVGEKSCFIKLSDFKGVSIQEVKTLEAINDDNCKYKYYIDPHNFLKIPGTSIAYWLKEESIDVFKQGKSLDSCASIITKGIFTGENNTFLRLWFEVKGDDIGSHKWNLYCKGGPFRRWYGNTEYVVLWENGTGKLAQFPKSGLGAAKYFEKPAFVWSKITNALMSFRWNPENVYFDDASPAIIFDSKADLYLLGLVNSKAIQYFLDILSPTMNNQIGDIKRIPVLIDETNRAIVEELVSQNIELAKEDFADSETSYEFLKHPLLRKPADSIVDAINEYYAYKRKQISQMRINEEKLNEIFNSLYGLQDLLSCDVSEDAISINMLSERDLAFSFIQYIVGCVFGRFSLDEDGIVYSGGNWDNSKYSTIVPDEDNIIPIMDEDYFEDDLTNKIYEFISIVFPNSNVDDNLGQLIKMLGLDNSNPKESLKLYLSSTFFKDHCDSYTSRGAGKRPIYWMFNTGKQGAFKCLVYMHRYTPDTVGRIRSDYLIKAQSMIENALRNAEYAINTSGSAVDRAQATKKRDRYIKQLAEIRAYYPALSHIALQRIELNLDDGVKANYEKFQGIEVSVEGEKKQKVDLLAKI